MDWLWLIYNHPEHSSLTRMTVSAGCLSMIHPSPSTAFRAGMLYCGDLPNTKSGGTPCQFPAAVCSCTAAPARAGGAAVGPNVAGGWNKVNSGSDVLRGGVGMVAGAAACAGVRARKDCSCAVIAARRAERKPGCQDIFVQET